MIMELTGSFFSLIHAHKAGDGVFSLQQDGFIKLVNLNSNATTNLVQISNLVDVSLVDCLSRARAEPLTMYTL